MNLLPPRPTRRLQTAVTAELVESRALATQLNRCDVAKRTHETRLDSSACTSPDPDLIESKRPASDRLEPALQRESQCPRQKRRNRARENGKNRSSSTSQTFKAMRLLFVALWLNAESNQREFALVRFAFLQVPFYFFLRFFFEWGEETVLFIPEF